MLNPWSPSWCPTPLAAYSAAGMCAPPRAGSLRRPCPTRSIPCLSALLGLAAKGAKKLDEDIDRQEALTSELRDFEDKLTRAANLHLDPDLNDGVVLNIAPFRELVAWKEAKSYWDDLMDGKYEWSSISKQLREKSMVRSPWIKNEHGIAGDIIRLSTSDYGPSIEDKGPERCRPSRFKKHRPGFRT